MPYTNNALFISRSPGNESKTMRYTLKRFRVVVIIYTAIKLLFFLRKSDTYPKLNLPSVRLRVERRSDGVYVWDELRGRFLLLTPEEWVRRHVVELLSTHFDADKYNLAQEYPIKIEGMVQRADIVWTTGTDAPCMLVECKAPDIPINRSVFAQAVRYNSIVGARYIMITNGLDTRIYRVDDSGEYAAVENIMEIKVL